FEPRMLAAGDADIGRGQEHIKPRPRRPAVDRGDDRLPHPRVVVAHAAVDAGLLPVDGAGERPEDAAGAQVFTLLLRHPFARREVVPAAEMPLSGAGEDRTTNLAVFPQIDPGLGNLVRGLFVED